MRRAWVLKNEGAYGRLSLDRRWSYLPPLRSPDIISRFGAGGWTAGRIGVQRTDLDATLQEQESGVTKHGSGAGRGGMKKEGRRRSDGWLT